MILGIAPGITNTGLAVVRQHFDAYKVVATKHVETNSDESTGRRLVQIFDAMLDMTKVWTISFCCMLSYQGLLFFCEFPISVEPHENAAG